MLTRSSLFPDRVVRLAVLVSVVALLATMMAGCARAVGSSQHDTMPSAAPSDGAMASADPVTIWQAGREDEAIDRLGFALSHGEPVLPPELRLSEQDFASRLGGLSQADRDALSLSLMAQHEPLDRFARAITARGDQARTRGDLVQARECYRLVTEFGRALQSPRLTLLTQAHGRGIVKLGQDRLGQLDPHDAASAP